MTEPNENIKQKLETVDMELHFTELKALMADISDILQGIVLAISDLFESFTGEKTQIVFPETVYERLGLAQVREDMERAKDLINVLSNEKIPQKAQTEVSDVPMTVGNDDQGESDYNFGGFIV
jgi:hypothetical protein